tara:strand:- start:1936 stop:2361 length:426 start_codon:yes stop_codon:yes gene_type:complete
MARKLYETEEHLKAEKYVAEYISRKWSVEMVKLPISQKIDYAMMRRDKVTALLEIKCRKFVWGEWPDIMLSLSKIKYAQEIYNLFEIKTFFAVCDVRKTIKYTPLYDLKYNVGFGGRKSDPRDNQDSELIMDISVYDFTEI